MSCLDQLSGVLREHVLVAAGVAMHQDQIAEALAELLLQVEADRLDELVLGVAELE